MNRSLFVCALMVLLALMNLSYRKSAQENHPPSVKITAPANLALFKTGTTVSYQIAVSDPEDGDSKYDEINPKEVLLEIKYVKENSGRTEATGKRDPADAPGLSTIAISNCFNCHNFSSKSIGPSLFDISKRYPFTKAIVDTLTRRIKNGSSGIWGKEKMPSHPELTVEQIKTTVEWILKNAAARDINYYNGLSGIIQFAPNRKGAYTFTAVYTDHGMPDAPAKQLRGFDRIRLKVE